MRPEEVTIASLKRYRRRYLFVTIAGITSAAMVMANRGSMDGFPTHFCLGLFVGLVVAVSLAILVGDWIDDHFMTTVIESWVKDKESAGLRHHIYTAVVKVVSLPKEEQLYGIHIRGVVVTVGFLFSYVFLVSVRPEWVTAAVGICALFGLIIAIYGFVRFNYPSRYFGAFLLLSILVAWRAGSAEYLHRFDGFTAQQYANPIALEDMGATEPSTDFYQ